ncbi:MAG: histidine kinase [Actinomycetota bacterium]|nr:histidine kinase [Actinomycetota bacterium]
MHATLVAWMVVSYVLAGLVAWWRRPESRFGALMVAAGFTIFVSSLESANVAVPFTIGSAFDLLPAVLFLHVFLAFPTGRLERSFERALVSAGYVVAFGVQLVAMALGAYGTRNLLELTSEPNMASLLQRAQLAALSCLMLIGVGVLASRRRGSGRPLRRSLALLIESFALGLVMVAFLFLSGAFALVAGGPAFEMIRRATFFVIGLAPLAFLAGLLQARLARSAIADLVVELRADLLPGDLREALARALRDPSLTLAYWLPDFRRYVDLQGTPVELAAEHGRATTLIDRNGVHVAALLHHRALADEPELLDAVGAAAGMALENARLQAELRARLDELRGSRARILEAALSERRRLERNLHDGAQQRLVAVSLELGLLEDQLESDVGGRARLERARREIAASLDELREIAHGLHPAVVSGHGLAVALEQLAARAPVPVELRVDIKGRLPEAQEVAAYYVVAEGLANIAKHACATIASVVVRRTEGKLLVEIVDDGVGGADTEQGSGLRGLADRVEALDGRLRIWTLKGEGTRVQAELPCA